MGNLKELLPRTQNGQAVSLMDVPVLDLETFRETIIEQCNGATRLISMFGHAHNAGQIRIYAILADHSRATIMPFAMDLFDGDTYPSLTPDCPQAHNFEREIAEQWGVVPLGHPWLKPLRYHPSYRPGRDAWSRVAGAPILPAVTDYFLVEGSEVHEVAVGPVHAGVIEPGSFRFQCHGEQVFHLEIQLGYQHRGVERALVDGPNKRTIHYLETLAGDTTIGHTTAYCQAVEGLSGTTTTPRANAIRGIALELERLACHTGDLGALSDDVGFLPTANYCGRLRGDFLNATGQICGNRFGRNLVRPGGVTFDIESAMAETLIGRMKPALRDVAGAARLLWNSLSVQSRFEDTGIISQEMVEQLGIVGVAQRATGIPHDIRQDFPSGIYPSAPIPISTWPSGDVYARAYVRSLEIERSGQFIIAQLQALPSGPIHVKAPSLAPDSMVVALVEGWRGAICHVAITNREGRFARYKVVDPSFHNWIGLAMSLRNQQISDFPLCNKSFNLSYCGHDL